MKYIALNVIKSAHKYNTLESLIKGKNKNEDKKYGKTKQYVNILLNKSLERTCLNDKQTYSETHN